MLPQLASTADDTSNMRFKSSPVYKDLDFDDEVKKVTLSESSIKHYDFVFEEFSYHLLAHEEFIKKKKLHKSSKEALNHNFKNFVGNLEFDKRALPEK
jgi:hypothetical protein